MILPSFSDRCSDIAMATNFGVKMSEIGRLTSIALAFLNGVGYRNSGFKRFIYADLPTLYKNLVNFTVK